jgi:hypothetical protein
MHILFMLKWYKTWIRSYIYTWPKTWQITQDSSLFRCKRLGIGPIGKWKLAVADSLNSWLIWRVEIIIVFMISCFICTWHRFVSPKTWRPVCCFIVGHTRWNLEVSVPDCLRQGSHHFNIKAGQRTQILHASAD